MKGLPPIIQILADTDQPHSIRSLAERSQGSYAAFHKAAHKLADQGCIRLERQGKELLAVAASSKIPALTKALCNSRMARDLNTLFRGDRDQLLWVLHRSGHVAITAEVMACSTRTVYNLIQTLSSRGIIVKGIRYHIHPSHAELIELLAELDRLRAEHRIKQRPGARLKWHLGPEMLLQTETAPLDAQLAGLDAFAQYGISIQTRGPPLYYMGNRVLTAADALMQDLVAMGYETPNSAMTPSGSRVIGQEFNYACLLWEKEEPKDLWVKSDLYFGDEPPARDVIEYVAEQSDEWAGFIPWSEHERLRKLYGIQS